MRMVCILILCLGLCGCATTSGNQQIRQTYVDTHPNISNETRQIILNGNLFIGMTKNEVKASWNSCDFNIAERNTDNAFGNTSMYYCGGHYFMFQNDKLTSVTESRY